MNMRRAASLLAAIAVLLGTTGAAFGQAEPSIRIEGPARVGQGETFTVTVVLDNVGDQDGVGYVVDIDVPVSGPDGRADTVEDGVELLSAGFRNTFSQGIDLAFDGLGRALHPLFATGGNAEVIKGKPGNLLWVSVDQLRQTALTEAANELEAEFRMGKAARPGRPLKIRFRGGFVRSSLSGGGPVVTRFRTLAVTPVATTLEEVAAGLAADAVFVSRAADIELSEADERALESAIANASTPIFLAVLPAAAGPPQSVLEELVELTGRPGTYAVVVGDRYRATSDRIPPADLEQLLAESGAGGESADPRTVLGEFVSQANQLVNAPPSAPAATVAETPAGEGSPPQTPPARNGGSSVPWIVAGAVLALLAALIGGRVGRRYLRKRRAQRLLVDQMREEAEEDLVALGEEIAALDLDVEMPDVTKEAKDEYGRAIAAYDEATRDLRSARTPAGLERVGERVAGGRHGAACTRALLAGEEPPPRRPQCFFDPRHGQAVDEIAWAPDGGTARLVPACAACATRIADGAQPQFRLVVVGGASVPYFTHPARARYYERSAGLDPELVSAATESLRETR